ncbi:uncharacterized protein LOC134824785 [Bolinopsis microptera]|uniref:uncharacterized protein LOC134824785 n=1 Tax=Bolinopsis microptera TaxID=2820187 RepID=UPI00307AFA9E
MNRGMFVLLVFTLLVHTSHCICKTKVNKREMAVLNAHNQYRRLHQNTPDLCYGISSKLVKYTTQHWSEHMLRENELSHSEGSYGENVWWGRDSKDAISAFNSSISNWYQELNNWNFTAAAKIDDTKDALHFTQVVWVLTSEVNCGFAFSSARGAFVTCQYYKQGNYATTAARRKNVQPLRMDPEPTTEDGPTEEPDDNIINEAYKVGWAWSTTLHTCLLILAWQ